MITSRQNPLIKEIKSLADKKNRDELNLFIVEGVKSVKEAVCSNFEIKKLIFTERGKELFGETDIPYEIVSDGVFSAISDEKTPQGVIAEVIKPKYQPCSPKKNCILLDEVKDPSNVGAIIRTAASCGYDEVYLINCADPYLSKAVRASMGGIFRVKTIMGGSEILEVINFPLVVADMNGENVFNKNITENFCLVIGNEGHGVDKDIKNKAKYTVKIPMTGGMESLNAAVSAGILMYALNEKIKGEN